MGCLGSKPQFLEEAQDEEAFHAQFIEDKVLGEGEFGQVKLVYEASNRDGPSYACKVLHKGYTFKNNTVLSPIKPEILRRECEILSALGGQHHCLGLKALFEGPSQIYLVTEFCEGGEMMQWIAQKETSTLRTEDVSRIAYETLDAVAYCHSKGIIHRDIKPENIMFQTKKDNASVKLIDFGSASYDTTVSAEDTSQMAEHHTFAGSAFYVSPEMFLQMSVPGEGKKAHAAYSEKVDIWSVGVTLYVLVAGYPAEQLQKAFNIIQTPPSKGRDLKKLPNLPENLDDSFFDLLESMLNYRHKQRMTAKELMDHDFAQFYKNDIEEDEEETGISLSDIQAAAQAPSKESNGVKFAESSGRNRKSVIKSRLLEGSVQRHSMFLDYSKFERSVTTLLATVLTNSEFEELLDTLEKHSRKEGAGALKVIKIKELKDVLLQLEAHNSVDLLEKLPNAAIYDDFAYHLSLLKLFTKRKHRDIGDSSSKKPSSGGSMDNSTGSLPGASNGAIKKLKARSSVHGNDVWSKWAADVKTNKSRPGAARSFGVSTRF